jgi:hypothetical protein
METRVAKTIPGEKLESKALSPNLQALETLQTPNSNGELGEREF